MSINDIAVTLIDGNLDRHAIACPGGPFFMAANSGIWGVSPARVQTERLAGLDGATLKLVAHDPKTLVVPVRIGGPGEDLTSGEQQNRFAQLMDFLRPELEVRIEVDRPGVHREITARYSRGAETERALRRHLLHPTQVINLEFLALDPVWRNVTDPVSSFPTTTFDNAFFGGVNEIVVNVNASLPVRPTFIIEGEVENVEAMHAQTGRLWRMVEEMQNQTDRMVIQTDPRAGVGAYLNGGQRQWFFDAQSELEQWQLQPGPNRIFMRGVSAGFGASAQFSIEWIDLHGQC